MVDKNLNKVLALLWKNFRKRLRNPVSWILDIILPAVLCCLLLVLYFVLKPVTSPMCNIKAKALPTAGGILFLQTFLCTAGNTCEDEEGASFESFNTSVLSNVGEEIKGAFNIKKKRSNKPDVNKLSDFHVIDGLIEAIDNDNKKWQLLYNILLRSNIYSPTSESRTSDINKLWRIKRSIHRTGILNSFIRILTNEGNSTEQLLGNFCNAFFCGPGKEGIEVQLMKAVQDVAVKHFQDDDDMSDYCNTAIKLIEGTAYKLILQYLRPLLFGKVVYTPDAPVITKIMKRFGDSLKKIKNVLDLLKVANKAWTELRAWKLSEITNKYKNEENLLGEILKTRTGRAIMERFKDGNNKHSEEIVLNGKTDLFKKLLNEAEEDYNAYLEETNANPGILELLSILDCIDFNKVIAKSNEGDALDEAVKLLEKDKLWGYIIFTNIPPGAEKLPPSITYKLRVPANKAPETNNFKSVVNTTGIKNTPIVDLKEIQGGTIHLQNIIEGELIREYTGRKDVPGIYLIQLPYPCFRKEGWLMGLELIKIIVIIGVLPFYCRIVKNIVTEKEILFKELLRIFGVTNAHHWIAFFIECLFTGCLSAILFTIIIKIITGYFLVFFIFELAYIISIIAFAFFMSTMFMKASYCTILAGIIFFFLYMIHEFLNVAGNPTCQILLCIIATSAAQYGCVWIQNMLESNMPLDSGFINYSPDQESPLTMLVIIIMLLIDSVIYILLAIYLENVISTRAVRKPWNYCFKAGYWKNLFKKKDLEVEISEAPEAIQSHGKNRKKRNSNNFEEEPDGTVGIEVINVTKEFGKPKNKIRVVNNLSIKFYENHITSFLGHNGAGKSTTVMMMTGVIAPTKGKILINGTDLRKNPEQALSSVGICFQENVLLDDLTVKDHLKLIGRLKGLKVNEINSHIKELLEDFEFSSRAYQPVKHLSGGWKRKICVAMAFMGGARTIFLDEPTAGIDPFARRTIWDVLIKLKNGRTIVLITHHLDEADVLGDRIAIIASGEIKCCGSSSFLKSQLGKGYLLTVDTTVRSEKTSSKESKNGKKQLSPQAQDLLGLVRSAISGAEFEEERGCEFVFTLPPNQSSSDLSRLFDALDRNKSKMNINTYGVSAISLEEVFMKVLKEADADEENAKGGNSQTAGGFSGQKSDKGGNDGTRASASSNEDNYKTMIPSVVMAKESNTENSEESDILNESPEISTKNPQPPSSAEMEKITLRQKEKFRARGKFWNHFLALWIKRAHHYKRNYIFLLVQILLPVVFLLVIFIQHLLTSSHPSVSVDVSTYDSTVLFYTNNIPNNPHLQSYENALLGPYGLGTKCILTPEKCSLKSIPKGSMIAEGKTIDSNKCICNNGELECIGNATAEPPEAKMTTGHKLFNMSGLDLNNWLVATEFKYSVKRIGGITFGHTSPLVGVSLGDFLSLFSEKNLLNVLEKFIFDGKTDIDPKKFTSELMSGLNRTYGAELFKDKDSADNIIVWFNSKDKLSSMAMVNGVANLVLRASLPNGTDPSSYSIQLILDPFSGKSSESRTSERSTNVLSIVICILQAEAVLFCMLLIHVMNENICGIKHLAFISGVSPIEYWLSYFLWDMVIFSLNFILLLLLIVIFKRTEFCGSNILPVFTAVFYSYAVTTIIFIYLLSNLFKSVSCAIIFYITWSVIVFPLLFLITNIIDNKIFVKIVMRIPEYNLARCLMNLAEENSQSIAFSSELKINYFQWDISTQYIYSILMNGGVYLIILMLFEFRNVLPFGLILKCCASLKLLCRNPAKKHEQDEDVTAEKERVLSNKAKEEGDMLIMKNLTKIYCGQVNPATDHVSVGIKQGECLGLLGMNGAGKTTVFKMLSGTITPTVGDAVIAGFSITYSPIKSRILIGYCPQANSLDPYLTPTEHLSFFCRVRGFDRKKRNAETLKLLEFLGLSKHKDKLSKNLSGGNQRKLCAAIALVGEPEVILLDEPTAGMDALARRFLWSRLLEALQDKRCLVLTTHSMEECQALATQVCIMFKGQFACFGSSQHLKNKFNEGYNVTVRLVNTDKSKDVINYLSENLPGLTVVRLQNFHLYVRLHPDTKIGKAVTVMGEVKRKQWIDDYSINQTTLESVFLKLIGEAQRDQAYEKPCCRL